MAKLIQQVGTISLRPKRLPVFQSLVQAIIYQQLSGKAAGTIFKRFLALFDSGAFPAPEEILASTPERLLSAGLSRPKERYVRGVAQSAAAGELPTLKDCAGLTDLELIERLTALKGVGRWTVEMFLIFNLGRPDVLPVHDLGVRRGFQVAYRKRKMPEPEQLDKFGQRWKPYRSLASQYLWRAVDGE